MSRLLAARLCAIALVAGTVAGCVHGAARPMRPRHDSSLITRADVQRTGATTAWDALRRSGSFAQITDTRRVGELSATHRGRSSFILSPQMLLVVDGAMMLDLAALKEITADRIDWIRILSAREATPTYGSDGGNGVIVVRTRIPDLDENS